MTIGRTPVVGMYKANGDVRTVCGYEAGLDICPSTRMNRKGSEGTRTSPVRPNNQPGVSSSGLLTSSFLPLAPRMSYCRSMNLGLLDLRVPIHAFKALCVRFYYCAGANPLLSICPPAFAILKDCIKTLYRHLFYYACL